MYMHVILKVTASNYHLMCLMWLMPIIVSKFLINDIWQQDVDQAISGVNGNVSIPWHVYIQREDPHNPGYPVVCSGTVVTSRFVLTARSCFRGNKKAKIIGRHQLDNAFVFVTAGMGEMYKGKIIALFFHHHNWKHFRCRQVYIYSSQKISVCAIVCVTHSMLPW